MELRKTQKAAFGFGAFGKDIVYMLIAGYILYYYNVVLGMSSAFIGTILMAARVFDAFNDPFMGIVVAKTRTKWGKYRPWIFVGTVLNAVTIYALYATPDSMSAGGQKIWLTVFYFAWGITYTLMDIPFWSVIPAITNPGKDREDLTSLARTCAGIGDAVPTVLTMVIVPAISASELVTDYKIGFKVWALIIAVVFVISETVCVIAVKERPVDEDLQTTGIGEMFRALIKNDQAMTVVGSIVLVYTALNLCSNLVLYFFQFDIGNEGAYSTFAAVAFAAQVLVMMTIPVFRKKFTKDQLFIMGFVIQIAGFIVILAMTFTPLCSAALWWTFCIPGMMVYAGYGILNVIMTVFLSDSVDYGEDKNGTRDEAIIFSMQTFTVKLASGLAVFIAGYVIKWINLDTTSRVQNFATLLGLRMWMTVPSVLLLVGGIYVYRKLYKLDDKAMNDIMERLKA